MFILDSLWLQSSGERKGNMKKIASGIYEKDNWRLEKREGKDLYFGYKWVLYGINESENFFNSKKDAMEYIKNS